MVLSILSDTTLPILVFLLDVLFSLI